MYLKLVLIFINIKIQIILLFTKNSNNLLKDLKNSVFSVFKVIFYQNGIFFFPIIL